MPVLERPEPAPYKDHILPPDIADKYSGSDLKSHLCQEDAADDILFGTKTEFRCTQVDIRQYEDREQILSEYHAAVRNEIERVKNSHE